MRYNTESRAFVLTKADTKSLLAFASKEAHREYICGVHFRPATGEAVATDGSTLALAKNCGQAPHDPWTVPRHAMEQAARLLRRKGDRLHVACEGTAVTLTAVDERGAPMGHVSAVAVATPFPPYEQIIPDHDALPAGAVPPVMAFDADLLARLRLVQAAAERKGLRVRYGDDDLAPVRFDTAGADTKWTAVVMPFRLT